MRGAVTNYELVRLLERTIEREREKIKRSEQYIRELQQELAEESYSTTPEEAVEGSQA